MNLQPLYDRVVVRRVVEEEKKGLLYIPEQAKEKPAQGIVLAVGAGRVLTNSVNLAPLAVQVGDRVLFGKYSGTETEVDGEKLLILREEEVLGRFA